LIILIFAQSGKSQTIINKNDTAKKHYPKLATLMSTVVPGLGQVYNKKYWKVPVIYIGLGSLGYMANKNNKRYKDFRNAYSDLYNSGNYDSTIYLYGVEYTLNGLETGKNYYRRYRDLFVIFTSGLYLMNIIDANVDANLFDFDISDDISLRFEPATVDGGMAGYVTGLRIRLSF